MADTHRDIWIPSSEIGIWTCFVGRGTHALSFIILLYIFWGRHLGILVSCRCNHRQNLLSDPWSSWAEGEECSRLGKEALGSGVRGRCLRWCWIRETGRLASAYTYWRRQQVLVLHWAFKLISISVLSSISLSLVFSHLKNDRHQLCLRIHYKCCIRQFHSMKVAIKSLCQDYWTSMTFLNLWKV